MDFESAVEFLIEKEDRYTYDQFDPRKESSYGLTKFNYPDLDLSSFTKEHAVEIYKRDYWDVVKADELPADLRLIVFDSAVSHGAHFTICLIQRILNLVVDGSLGPKTLQVLEKKTSDFMLKEIALERALAYTVMKKFKINGKDWLRRLYEIVAVSYTNKEK